tara:strand:+ start:257 stop:889 length:633 start_codon:yes stop_codon:yes gene_type:complete
MAYIGSKPANKPIVASDLDPAVRTGQTALATAPADTDEFLISDAGVLKRIDASLIGADGITMADQFRLSANRTSDEDPISANVERVDTGGQGFIGTGMTNSSGIFSFPSTGVYLVKLVINTTRTSSNDTAIDVSIYGTVDNSSYVQLARARTSGAVEPPTMMGYCETLVDVTNTTNVKVKFVYGSSGSNTLQGNSAVNMTTFTFIRLGNT